jgi:hypothetical protein
VSSSKSKKGCCCFGRSEVAEEEVRRRLEIAASVFTQEHAFLSFLDKPDLEVSAAIAPLMPDSCVQRPDYSTIEPVSGSPLCASRFLAC